MLENQAPEIVRIQALNLTSLGLDVIGVHFQNGIGGDSPDVTHHAFLAAIDLESEPLD